MQNWIQESQITADPVRIEKTDLKVEYNEKLNGSRVMLSFDRSIRWNSKVNPIT
jgi:hypothetical protein